jgi:hypothetical protein
MWCSVEVNVGIVCVLTWVPVVNSLTHTRIHQDRAVLCLPPNLLLLTRIKGYWIMAKITLRFGSVQYSRVTYPLNFSPNQCRPPRNHLLGLQQTRFASPKIRFGLHSVPCPIQVHRLVPPKLVEPGSTPSPSPLEDIENGPVHDVCCNHVAADLDVVLHPMESSFLQHVLRDTGYSQPPALCTGLCLCDIRYAALMWNPSSRASITGDTFHVSDPNSSTAWAVAL